MDISNQTANTPGLRPSTAYKEYIEFTREPFEVDEFTIILQDGRTYDLAIEEYHLFFRRMNLVIPPLVIDVLFNFNNVRWYPDEQRMEPM